MTVHVALLRGVNVGGHKHAGMSDLRNLLAKLGFASPRSLLQSGNLVFGSDAKRGAELERYVEDALKEHLGLQTDVIVRTAAEWKSVVARNRFHTEAQRDPSHLVVMFLKRKPNAESVEDLRAAIAGPELLHADGKQLYVTYPAGIGNSRLTNNLIDSKLRVRGTGRNWNTVLKLATMAES